MMRKNDFILSLHAVGASIRSIEKSIQQLQQGLPRGTTAAALEGALLNLRFAREEVTDEAVALERWPEEDEEPPAVCRDITVRCT